MLRKKGGWNNSGEKINKQTIKKTIFWHETHLSIVYSSHRFFYGKQFVQSFWLHSKWASSAVLCREFTLPLFLYLTLLRYLDSFWQETCRKMNFLAGKEKTDWNSQPLFFKFPSFSKSSFLSFYYYYYHFSFLSLSLFSGLNLNVFFLPFYGSFIKLQFPLLQWLVHFFFFIFYFRFLPFLLFKMHFALVETAFLNKRN